MKPKITPTNVEVRFLPEEIIVSKTDLKGRITYANRVFMRVADYSEDDLLGVQHNIVRHPDMPRGAFRHLWDTIQRGEEWFGFVKLFSMLVSQISGVTGGVLAPSLAIGAGFGYDIGRLLPEVHPQAMALLGMVGFFAGFSRSPLTGLVVVVMEMTESPSMIVPLMVTALIASGVSRQFNRKSLYEAQAQLLLSALVPPPATRKDN